MEKVYSGPYLVKKVYEELKVLNDDNKAKAWGDNKKIITKHQVEYAADAKKTEETKKHATWTIPAVGEHDRRNKKPKITVMQPVERLPPMQYWEKTPVNLPTADSKSMTHLPYLDEREEEMEQFHEELNAMFEYDLTVNSKYAEYPISPDVFLDFMRVLIKVGEKYGEKIFSDELAVSDSKPSSAVLRNLYKDVQVANTSDFVSKKPCSELLTTICKVFPNPNVITSEDLLTRYVRFSRRHDPAFNRHRDAPPDVDIESEDTVARSRNVQMDSYKSLFCRLCCKYACVQHVLMNAEEISSMQKVVKLQKKMDEKEKLLTKKSSAKLQPQPQTIKCHFAENCYRNGTMDKLPLLSKEQLIDKWENILLEWSTGDRSMFNCMYESYKNYCLVATMLANKTCFQVMSYHRIFKLMKENGHFATTSKSSNRNETVTASCSRRSGRTTFNSTSANDSTICQLEDDKDNFAELYSFIPCAHKDGICDETCNCVANKTFCESICGCLKSCKNRFGGCICRTTCNSKRCPCFCANRECNPDLCKPCGAHEIDVQKITCKNVSIQRKLAKPVLVKKSTVSGWGAFAGTLIKKGEYIGEYTGQLISNDETERRGHVYDEKNHTFLFGLTENLVLDASRIGGECRFINSSKTPNCQPVKKIIRGESRLGIMAIKNIQKDEELFINYHAILDFNKMNKSVKGSKSKKYITDK